MFEVVILINFCSFIVLFSENMLGKKQRPW